jgi:hypothetical protein
MDSPDTHSRGCTVRSRTNPISAAIAALTMLTSSLVAGCGAGEDKEECAPVCTLDRDRVEVDATTCGEPESMQFDVADKSAFSVQVAGRPTVSCNAYHGFLGRVYAVACRYGEEVGFSCIDEDPSIGS